LRRFTAKPGIPWHHKLVAGSPLPDGRVDLNLRGSDVHLSWFCFRHKGSAAQSGGAASALNIGFLIAER